MIYAFIPARSGSTRLKDKNFLMLKEKRLFEWSVDTANSAKSIDKIIFSSDSKKYIDYVSSLKLEKELIIDHRSDLNSSDNTKIYDYLKGDFLQNNSFINENDSIVMLLPTQPFREINDVQNIIKLGIENNCNYFSSRKYSFHVSFAFEILSNGDFKELFENSPLRTGDTRSQDQISYFHPDGSVYFITVQNLMNSSSNSVYFNSRPYKSSSKYFVDIDDISDFEYAEKLSKLI